MLCIVQYPIADIRLFKAGSAKLPRPSWPFPHADREYVRSFGAVRVRPRGGVNSWLGEAHVCDASNLFSFVGSKFLSQDTYKSFKKKVAFRRFFSDGQAVGKLEVGVVVKRPPWPGPFFHANTLIFNLLKAEIVCAIEDGCKSVNLGEFSPVLRRAYAEASSPVQAANLAQKDLYTGKLQIVLECREHEMRLPNKVNSFRIGRDTTIHFWRESVSGESFNIWAIVTNESSLDQKMVREFRIYIARLYVEQFCLSEVMKAIATKKISATPFSVESDRLQLYVSSAIKRVTKIGRSAQDLINAEIWDMALDANDRALPGMRDALLAQVELWKPRPSVQSAIRNYTVLNLGTIMRDKNINEGQANSVGSDATISGTVMNQTINKSPALAPSEILDAIRTILPELRTRAENSDQKIDIKMIEDSIPLLESNRQDDAKSYLKRCSAWVLDTAEDFGAKIASETLKSYISG